MRLAPGLGECLDFSCANPVCLRKLLLRWDVRRLRFVFEVLPLHVRGLAAPEAVRNSVGLVIDFCHLCADHVLVVDDPDIVVDVVLQESLQLVLRSLRVANAEKLFLGYCKHLRVLRDALNRSRVQAAIVDDVLTAKETPWPD